MSIFLKNWIEGKASLAKTRSISGESFDGYITEMSCISQEAITSIPDTYSYAEAATLPCAALTAGRGLMEEGQLTAGESVLIEGSGGMSIFGMQLALAAGARVFATTSSEEKAERLKSIGAEAVLNYKEDSRWGKSLFKMTGGIDHVLDVGGGSTMEQSIEAAAIGGHVVSIGILGGGRKGEITFPKLFFKHIKVSGIAVGSRVMQERMVKAINQSGFKPIIDKSFSFDQLADAFRHQGRAGASSTITLSFLGNESKKWTSVPSQPRRVVHPKSSEGRLRAQRGQSWVELFSVVRRGQLMRE